MYSLPMTPYVDHQCPTVRAGVPNSIMSYFNMFIQGGLSKKQFWAVLARIVPFSLRMYVLCMLSQTFYLLVTGEAHFQLAMDIFNVIRPILFGFEHLITIWAWYIAYIAMDCSHVLAQTFFLDIFITFLA